MHSLAYETAKQRASTGLDSERMALAALADATPEILYFLAADATPAVRAAVAANAAAPIQADRLLAADADPAVRAEVGRKLAPRAPALAAAQDRLGALGWRVLCGLAEDAAVRVRAVIAEELKAMPDAPRELILRLAGDAAMEVAEPVLRLSPLLTEADLLALVAGPPDAATITAIARRPALSERLSDAIATTADTPAIAALLGNASATICESTLDALIVQAATRVHWQEALVCRPALPPRALQALALCVAGHLLQPLSARRDLPPALAETLRSRVAERLAQQALGDAPPPSPEDLFEAAAMRGDLAAMAGLLATHAAVPPGTVECAARLRSAKALVSLCWQAGFGIRSAVLAQSVLGQLAPGAVLMPTAAGGWPISTGEMLWQIELLAEPVG